MAEGVPAEIVTPALIERVYNIGCQVIADPETGTPLVVPRRSPVPTPLFQGGHGTAVPASRIQEG